MIKDKQELQSPPLEVAGQTFRLTKAATFEAAHYMGTQPDGHPYRNVHGHSFRIEVTVAGTVQPGMEWVEDFASLNQALAETAEALDHRLLNDLPGLEVPTLERLCVWVANHLAPRVRGLERVTLERPSLGERCSLSVTSGV